MPLPTLKVNYSTYLVLPNPIFRSKVILGASAPFVFISDIIDLFLGKLSNWRIHSFSVCLSSFVGTVSAVIEVCAQKKMIGPHARSVVTLMAHQQPLWDFSVVNFIGEPVSAKALAIPAPFSNICITPTIQYSDPSPTIIGFFNSTPKSSQNRYTSRHCEDITQ
jgi:hypothetical protein